MAKSSDDFRRLFQEARVLEKFWPVLEKGSGTRSQVLETAKKRFNTSVLKSGTDPTNTCKLVNLVFQVNCLTLLSLNPQPKLDQYLLLALAVAQNVLLSKIYQL